MYEKGFFLFFLCKACIAHLTKGMFSHHTHWQKRLGKNGVKLYILGFILKNWVMVGNLHVYKLLHYDEKNGTLWAKHGEILHGVEKLSLCVFFSFLKSYVNFILFFSLCTFSWEVEFQDVVDFESSRFIFEVDQWLKTDDHMTTQEICYYN